jgi:hypothetical protein
MKNKPTKIRAGLYSYKGFQIERMDNRGIDGGGFYGRSEIITTQWNVRYIGKDGEQNPACERSLKEAVEWCNNNLYIQEWMTKKF